MLHLVDHSDHWSHRDRSITAVNFLRYSDSRFSLTCLNPQNYQNRLWHSEYVKMPNAAGFEVLREDKEVKPDCLLALRDIALDRRFSGFAPEDLATTRSTILCAAAATKPQLVPVAS